ncbi:MAG: hypothetical protein KatS3mg077_3128 [Candidatus Binatia bacterium]|nr:MAG: hypothetical protein KatS3mg077_3128 [Candidatus Binatia bacterium]
MKKVWAVVIGSGILALSSAAYAQVSGFPTRAVRYSTWLARAFDGCTPSGLTVVSPSNLPSTGCFAAHSDPLPPPAGTNPVGAPMKFGRLDVRRFPATGGQGKVKLLMTGLQNGQRVKVRLTLRTTRSGVGTKNPTKSNQLVTFQDVTVDCPVGPSNCFIANPRGVVLGNVALDACLTQNSQPTGLARQNVEILDAEVINCDDNNVVARPGILN